MSQPLHRSQIKGVELPLDLDGVDLPPAALSPGTGHRGRAYRGLPRADRAGRDCRGLPRIARGATVTCEEVARRAMTAELPSPTDVVQAAGGLVVRRQGGVLEIVVVHRPLHQDWSFPAGKLEEPG